MLLRRLISISNIRNSSSIIMGKNRPRFRKHNNAQTPRDPNSSKQERKPYENIVKENEKFVEYYKVQNVCKPEEFNDFIESLKTDLPATFRITGSKGQAKKMLEIVQGQFLKDCLNQGKEGEGDSPRIFPLPWYPDNLAWQLDITRKDIRRSETYYKLHNFLITETENGTISRQETVSMIPPLVLDVQSHHKVLDMCAAPGSKTAQLLEMLHSEEGSLPSGYVIANDVDNKRCYMLVHQAKRLNSPCMAIINHDSAILPNMTESLADGSTQQVQFDRILCDVPCSGDGTLRKNPDIWMKWTPANGINLHGIQSRIIRRGIELLAVGGKLVYSTCSINPVENEAVIHRILSENEGALRLVDVSSNLPGLKYTEGLETWTVGSRNLEFYNSFEEVDDKWKTTIRPQMFPPKHEDKEKFNLKKCIRILPHQQNTGAFFVAVLEKLKPISAKEKADEKCEEKETKEGSQKRISDDRLPQNQRKRRRQEGYKEDPFVFFKDDETVWPEIKSFYEINDSFDSTCLLVRCHTGKKKNIYYTSNGIRDLVIKNQDRIKFINTGVKLFVRCDNRNMKCAFRIANDGLESVFNFIGDSRKVLITKEDLIMLLLNDNPQKSPPIETLSDTVRKQAEALSPGSCVIIYQESGTCPFTLHLSGWRGTTSFRCYMDQHSTVHLLRLLGADISKYEKNKFKANEIQDQEVKEEIQTEG